MKIHGQENEKIAPNPNDTFLVIVDLADSKGDQVAKAIQSASPGLGLNYYGYCPSQHCVIVRASTKKYTNLQIAVLEALRRKYGASSITGLHRETSFKEFWQNCEYSSPQGYRYFKTMYGK